MPLGQVQEEDFRGVVESHERALRVHCYRLLGSLQDAEDLTQETLLRAWRSFDRFDGRGPLRAWLYRIATNACLDEIDRRGRRLLPTMLGSPQPTFDPGEAVPAETPWLEPMPDSWNEPVDTSPGPEARYEARESIELAFIAALQRLPGRQRAALLLRDVLGWSTPEVANTLELSVSAIHSILQRARATLGQRERPATARLSPAEEQALVERYVHAWEHADLQTLVDLLKSDARLSMPPLAEWYIGIDAISAFFRWATGPDGMGPYRYVHTRANGMPALKIYADEQPAIIQVLEMDRDGIGSMTSFMNPALFKFFDDG